jgi:NitT/TauT family transport system ATP-binding protein
MLKIINWSFGYNNKPIFINFGIEFGDNITCLIAKNGIGKSTLLNQINEKFVHSKNSINTSFSFPVESKLRYITQNPNDSLFPWYTPTQNLTVMSKLQSITSQVVEFERELKHFGINPDHKVARLSGGQKQLINTLITIYINPTIALLDEPFGALDIENNILITNRFKQWQKQSKSCVILISHSKDEILRLSDRIIIMDKSPTVIVNDISQHQIQLNGSEIINNFFHNL